MLVSQVDLELARLDGLSDVYAQIDELKVVKHFEFEHKGILWRELKQKQGANLQTVLQFDHLQFVVVFCLVEQSEDQAARVLRISEHTSLECQPEQLDRSLYVARQLI